jgi:lipopolysaccharide export system permease protein
MLFKTGLEVMSARRGAALPRLYVGKFLTRVLIQAVLVVLLIEAIFMTEKLNDVLRSALAQNASLDTILLLLGFRAPEVFGLAIPLALLIAVYRVTLRFREDRELLILSGMGVGTHKFIWLAVGAGLAAQILSLILSGLVAPAAAFGQRQLLFDAHYKALRGGISAGQFYGFGQYTVFAGPNTKSDARGLFLHRTVGDEEQAVIANQASLEGPRDDGTMTLHLQDFASTWFASAAKSAETAGTGPSYCSQCSGITLFEPISSTRVGNLTQELEVKELFAFDPRGSNLSERTFWDLVGMGSTAAHSGSNDAYELGRRISRSLLCLLAPLIAGIGIVFTNRTTHVAALPVACSLLMCVDLLFNVLVEKAAGFGILPGILSPVIVTLAVFAVGARWLSLTQNDLVKPGLSRA